MTSVNFDKSSEFISIFNAEKSAYRGNNKAYVTQDTGEYFAESFCDYTENPSVLNILINSLDLSIYLPPRPFKIDKKCPSS